MTFRKIALWALLPLLLASACANPPKFVKKNAVLRALFYSPWGQPYVTSPNFTFVIRRSWKGPVEIPDGVRYVEKRKRASISIAYHPQGTPNWTEPEVFKRRMREQGSVEDRHVLDEIIISTRPASRVFFTTYEYDSEYLIGEKMDVLYTELILIPDPEGIYVIRFESLRSRFGRYRKGVFRPFLKSLTLPELKQPEE